MLQYPEGLGLLWDLFCELDLGSEGELDLGFYTGNIVWISRISVYCPEDSQQNYPLPLYPRIAQNCLILMWEHFWSDSEKMFFGILGSWVRDHLARPWGAIRTLTF